jgi:hypothetical protein
MGQENQFRGKSLLGSVSLEWNTESAVAAAFKLETKSFRLSREDELHLGFPTLGKKAKAKAFCVEKLE